METDQYEIGIAYRPRNSAVISFEPLCNDEMSLVVSPRHPLAARKPGDPYQDGEVPDTDYNVVVFENRFPSMVRVPIFTAEGFRFAKAP